MNVRLEQRLGEQLALLADACRAFDDGKIYQMKNMSTRLYVICHDLVRDREWRTWSQDKKIVMLTTAVPIDPSNLVIAHHPLVGISTGSHGVSFSPFGSNPPPYKIKFLRFGKWWSELVLRSDAGRLLTRKNLVFQMRHYDGGSHGLDKEPHEDYSHMVKNRNFGWEASDGQKRLEFRLSALEATTRQIAHEVLYSMMPKLPHAIRKIVEYDLAWSSMPSDQPTLPMPQFAD